MMTDARTAHGTSQLINVLVGVECSNRFNANVSIHIRYERTIKITGYLGVQLDT